MQNCTTTKFNYDFITSILKLHNLIAQIKDFSQYECFIEPITKKMRFRAKNSAIHELIALLKANQIARITSDFKMDVIKCENSMKLKLKLLYLCDHTCV